MNELIYTLANFEEVKEIWKTYLWNARESKIEEVSAVDKDGEIDMKLMLAVPVFFKCTNSEGQIVGVISGFKTSECEFRSRGIWVSDEYRAKGIGSKLLELLEKKALELSCTTLWSMPRKVSWNFYQKNDFKILKEINHFEYSPHYIAEKSL